jgi:NADH-quinone oxidoreductase subunit G
MEGSQTVPRSSLVPFYWSPGWNSVQAINKYLDEPNGKMKGGDSGIKLIKQTGSLAVSYFKPEKQSNVLQKGEWLIVPAFQIFGSEELSSSATTLAKRIAEPFVYMNPDDSVELDVKTGDFIQLEIDAIHLKIKVITEESIGKGIAGCSVNLPGMPYIDLPGNGKFYK